MKLPGKLSRLFAGVTMLTIAHAVEAREPDVLLNDLGEPYKPELFLPTALCASGDAPADVAAIAFSDERFGDVPSWQNTNKASDILTQRICRDGFPDKHEDSIVSDVIRRLDDANPGWLSGALRPFFEANPAGYWRFNLDIEQASRLKNMSAVRVDFSSEALKMIAAGKGLAGSQGKLHERSQKIEDMPEFDDIIKTLFENAPYFYWEKTGGPRTLAKKADPSLRPTGEMLLRAARNPAHAYRLLFGYDDYADLPEAQEIVRTLMQANPLVIIANPYVKVPAALEGNPLIQVDASTLLQLAEGEKQAEYLINNFKSFIDLPEGRDILARAIESNPDAYMRGIRYEAGLRGITEEWGLRPSAQAFLKKKNPSSAEYFIDGYSIYADMPEARRIVQSAIDAAPAYFLRQRSSFSVIGYSEVPAELLNDWTLAPSVESLLSIARATDGSTISTMTNSASIIYNHYKSFSMLPEAKQIAMVAIEADPCNFIRGVMVSEELKSDITMRPSAQTLMRVARDGKCTYGLVLNFSLYQHMPEAVEIAQAAADADPQEFWRFTALFAGDIPAVLKEVRPTWESVAKVPGQPDGAAALITSYGQYRDYPGARGLVKAAISEDPAKYFSLKRRGELHEELKNDPAFAPDAKMIMRAAQARKGNTDLLLAYKEYKDMPEAPAIFRVILDTGSSQVLTSLRYAESNELVVPDGFVTVPAGKTLSARNAIQIYMMENHPVNFATEHSLMGKEVAASFLKISWHKAVKSFLLSVTEKPKAGPIDILVAMAEPSNVPLVNGLEPAFRKELLDRLVAGMDVDCKTQGEHFSNSDIAAITNQQSWLMKNNAIPPDILARALVCLVQNNTSYAFDLLRNGHLDAVLLKPEVAQAFRQALPSAALPLLTSLTKSGKARGINLPRLKLSYETLAQWAGEKISADAEKDRGKGRLESEYDSDSTFRQVITILNNLHDENDAARFLMLKNLKPDHYSFLIGRDSSFYYTSTFNKIFSGVKTAFQTDEAFRARVFSVDGGGRDFLSNLALLADNFGRLDELLDIFSDREIQDAGQSVLGDVVHSNMYTFEARSIPVLASLMVYAREKRGAARELEQAVLQAAINTKNADPEKRAYGDNGADAIGMVAALYAPGRDRDDFSVFFDYVTDIYGKKIDHYNRTSLPANDLFDGQGNSFQRVVFYNDPDGQSSFSSFVSTYRQDPSWQFADNKTYVTFSRNGVHVLANKPVAKSQGQKDISEFVKAQGAGAKISALVHRGHSYHVSDTLRSYLDKDIKFMWLGACQSSSVWEYLHDAPDMQFIYSKNIGTMRVNDPIMKTINDNLAKKRDLEWISLRGETLRVAGAKRGGDYIFPDGSAGYAVRMTAKFFANQKQGGKRQPVLFSMAAEALKLPPAAPPAPKSVPVTKPDSIPQPSCRGFGC